MSSKLLMAGLLLCLSSHTLIVAAATVTGVVKDSSENPVEFANFTLLSPTDSTLIDGMVTGIDGLFSLRSESSPCLLRVTAMGYESLLISNPSGDMGTLHLVPSGLTLGEVEVKGSAPVPTLKADGLKVPVAGTYLARTGTALDLLGKLPFVSRTGKEVEVIGKGTPAVYINGRLMRDPSELEQLASADIKAVDVVTAPGARYDASVNAVIRIVTVSPQGEGLSLNDRTTVGYKHYVYLFEQLNFNYRKGGFDIFGMLNYENYRERPANDNFSVQYLPSGIVESAYHGTSLAKYPVYQGKIGLNYSDKGHFAGLFYDFSYRPADMDDRSFSSRVLDGVLEDVLDYHGESSRRNRQHLLSAYYTGSIGKWELSANLDAMWQDNDRNTDEIELSAFNPARDFRTSNDVTNRLLAANITASFPMWKGDMRFGTEVIDVRRHEVYGADVDFISGNDTRIEETTGALFAESTQNLGKLSVSAGLRWEYTDSRYSLYGVRMTDRSRTYSNLAPSASLAFPIGGVSTNLSYVRKTTRPAFGQLGSAVRYLDRYRYESGNPYLKPIYRDYVSLSGQWKDLVVELSWCSTSNYFMWQEQPYTEVPGATILRMENMPRFNTYDAFVNYSPSFFGIWRPTFMAGVEVQDFCVMHNGKKMRLDNPLGVFRFNNAVHIPWDVWLNVDFQARTAGNAENLHVGSQWGMDVGVYKEFADDTWSVKLQLNDVFGSMRRKFISYDAISTLKINKIEDTRDLFVTVRYNFNSARSRYRGRGAANSEKNRL